MHNLDDKKLMDRQRWKLWLFGACFGVVGMGLWFSQFVAAMLSVAPAAVMFGATALEFLILVAACVAIRCPSCRLSLPWYALSKKPAAAWLSWLLDAKACPRCGQVDTEKV